MARTPQTDDDRRRLTGVGLVVADAWEEGSQAELDGAAFYLAHTKTDATLQLVDGARVRVRLIQHSFSAAERNIR